MDIWYMYMYHKASGWYKTYYEKIIYVKYWLKSNLLYWLYVNFYITLCRTHIVTLPATVVSKKMGNDIAGVKKPAEDVVVIANNLERRTEIFLDRCERNFEIFMHVVVMLAYIAVYVALHYTLSYDNPYIEYFILLALIAAFIVLIKILYLLLSPPPTSKSSWDIVVELSVRPSNCPFFPFLRPSVDSSLVKKW